jgi:NAD(P)-dependent dehydrogenase (short-subunit alcohol dehydrogenase family)
MSKKLVVITGASTGIGRATALQLARRGYHVIACVRKIADGEALLREGNENLAFFILDVNDGENIDKLREHVGNFFKPASSVGFFALINNAGVSPVAPIAVVSKEEMEFIFKTNVFGVVELIQALFPYLAATSGRIVNISSGSGVMAIPLSGAYSMSKFALEALSDILRIEFKQFGIKTVVVEPGLIRTSIHGKNLASMEEVIASLSPEQKNAYERHLRVYVEAQGKQAETATPADEVGKVIIKALESKKPKARYGAGKDAKALRMIHWLLSDRLRDMIVSKIGAW